VYTPRILDTLAQHQARATFFLVGERAQRHPEIVRAIAQGHHEIGNHTFTHVHLWLASPARTRREMAQCADLLSALAGRPPQYFRPPWGKFNLIAYRQAARLGEIRVLWSLRAEGWLPVAAPEAIVQTIERRLHPGAVIDLHDGSSVSGSPARTAEALPQILELLHAYGYQCLPLGELLETASGSPTPHGVRMKVWDWYEHAWASLFREEPVSDDGALGITMGPYRGPVVVLQDGTEIRAGDPIGEFHLRRDHLMRLHREVAPGKVGLVLRRELIRGLHALAALAARDPRYQRLRAFHGVSLWSQEARMLGLEPRPITSWWQRRTLGWYMRLLLARDHPLGRRRLEISYREAGDVWISRARLVTRYGRPATAREHP
jgi:hypothetical protein